MKKLLVICGPTATGKTNLAIYLAKKFKGEIVSADSRQVYKGMDVVTGKDLPKISNFQFPIPNLKLKNFDIGYYEVGGVKIWLYDVVNPDYLFNVSGWVNCANLVIKDIVERGRLPIVVGGTGFYIKALIEGIKSLGIPPNWQLRHKLSNLSIIKLSNYLKKINPEKWQKMNESDRKNPRRLIRAIEIAICKKEPPFYSDNLLVLDNKNWDMLTIALKAPFSFLYQKIDQRVEERIKMGAEKEIEALIKKGYLFENSALGSTIGYKEWKDYFTTNNKQKTKKEIIQKWKFNEHNYARRQMTWFKKQKSIKWFDITQKKWENKLEKEVTIWYTQKNAKKN